MFSFTLSNRVQNAAFVAGWQCRRAAALAAIGKSWWGREKKRSPLGEPRFLTDGLQVACLLGAGREAACPLPACCEEPGAGLPGKPLPSGGGRSFPKQRGCSKSSPFFWVFTSSGTAAVL